MLRVGGRSAITKEQEFVAFIQRIGADRYQLCKGRTRCFAGFVDQIKMLVKFGIEEGIDIHVFDLWNVRGDEIGLKLAAWMMYCHDLSLWKTVFAAIDGTSESTRFSRLVSIYHNDKYISC
jgi:hypothetical protein